MTSIKNTIFAGAAAFIISMTASAFAQQAPTQSGEKMDRAKMAEKMKAHMKEGMEKHHAQMHDALKLTPAQEPAWTAFTDATKPVEHAQPQDKKQMEAMSAPAHMEMMINHAQERIAMMQKHLGAVKTFYAVLTPEQQKTFDKMAKRMHQQHQHMRMKQQEKMHDMMQKKAEMKTN